MCSKYKCWLKLKGLQYWHASITIIHILHTHTHTQRWSTIWFFAPKHQFYFLNPSISIKSHSVTNVMWAIYIYATFCYICQSVAPCYVAMITTVLHQRFFVHFFSATWLCRIRQRCHRNRRYATQLPMQTSNVTHWQTCKPALSGCLARCRAYSVLLLH